MPRPSYRSRQRTIGECVSAVFLKSHQLEGWLGCRVWLELLRIWRSTAALTHTRQAMVGGARYQRRSSGVLRTTTRKGSRHLFLLPRRHTAMELAFWGCQPQDSKTSVSVSAWLQQYTTAWLGSANAPPIPCRVLRYPDPRCGEPRVRTNGVGGLREQLWQPGFAE